MSSVHAPPAETTRQIPTATFSPSASLFLCRIVSKSSDAPTGIRFNASAISRVFVESSPSPSVSSANATSSPRSIRTRLPAAPQTAAPPSTTTRYLDPDVSASLNLSVFVRSSTLIFTSFIFLPL